MFGFFKVSEDLFYKELLSDDIDINKIQKYIEKGIDINKKDEKGRSILFILSAKRKIDAIRILLKNNININIEDRYGRTVLDEAALRSDGIMIRFFLDNGFDINRKNSMGRTILQDVALEGDYKIFQILMNNRPDFNIKDSYGKTVLFDAVEGQNINIIKDVVNNVDSLNILDENYQTALFKAVLKDNIEIAKLLIVHGINVNFLDKDGQNVLFNTILQGSKNIPIIELLMKKDINMNIVDNNNKNVLDELLYVHDLQKNTSKELDGKYKLITPEKEYLPLALMFINNGLDIDKIHEDGKTTLQIEIENKNFANVEFLVNCGADLNVVDENDKNIIYKEILKGYSNYQMIDFLVSKGASLEAKDLDEKTIFDDIIEIIAITKGFKKVNPVLAAFIKENEKYDVLLKKILTYRPNIEAQRLDGKNILFDLVTYNDFETLKMIINYGVNLNIKDKRGSTPLMYMVEEGLKIKDKKEREFFIERLVYFLKYRVSVDIQDVDGRTVLHKAVIANDLTVVEKLLTKKADLTITDIHGRTALHHTQWHGNYKIARWLIAAGADMNQLDNSGFTLLNYAAIFGHVRLVIALIASGVLMYNRNSKNRKVAQFFKDRENNLEKLLVTNTNDLKMQKALEEVVENLKKEINEALI
ncbi:ankyrin domain-containing protein [Arcobacter acticola]|uniref:Ankyrin domain-containing protein n=1 Tax=Arcobacter acticola TaxID=1849015 RepID=A0A6M8EZA6_9BACT|nr:ankyrin repeat domain-containing protein [Arcobacter acticola]QKE29895.1 ankyrin domain-containing protein [Arcobacter acticola]